VTRLTEHLAEDCAVAGVAANTAAELLVAFESTCDFLATNADGNREIFQVDAAGVISQLTDTIGCVNTNPASNGTGDFVVFESDCDTGSNADRNVEIYSVDAQGLDQLTQSSFCTNLSPSVNEDGSLVVFDSDCDFIGTNMDASVEIFRLAPGGAISQLSDDRPFSGCASINAVSDASGTMIAFESDCDLVGSNGDQDNEIFQYRSGVGVVQLTFSLAEPCINATPATSQDGMTIVFSSDCDLVGGNFDASSEIFINDRDVGNSQLSSDPGNDDCESLSPSITSDGESQRVVFTGHCDLTSGNADGSFEIFRTIDGAMARLTDGVDCASISPQITGSGDSTVFLSNCDIDGAGADGLDIYLIDLCTCGGPMSRSTSTATDSLLALNAAVGNAECALCDCDVNNDALVTAVDALIILNKAVGTDINLSCP
jgi:Tol biopolymer transport system component